MFSNSEKLHFTTVTGKLLCKPALMFMYFVCAELHDAYYYKQINVCKKHTFWSFALYNRVRLGTLICSLRLWASFLLYLFQQYGRLHLFFYGKLIKVNLFKCKFSKIPVLHCVTEGLRSGCGVLDLLVFCLSSLFCFLCLPSFSQESDLKRPCLFSVHIMIGCHCVTTYSMQDKTPCLLQCS